MDVDVEPIWPELNQPALVNEAKTGNVEMIPVLGMSSEIQEYCFKTNQLTKHFLLL
jgi:hypothetical protein